LRPASFGDVYGVRLGSRIEIRQVA